MLDSIPATKAKNNFGELIKRVYTSGEPVVVEKGGIPVVVILPHSQFHSSDAGKERTSSDRSPTRTRAFHSPPKADNSYVP